MEKNTRTDVNCAAKEAKFNARYQPGEARGYRIVGGCSRVRCLVEKQHFNRQLPVGLLSLKIKRLTAFDQSHNV